MDRAQRLTAHAGIALASAAGLILQVALTRVFSVVQWYHFAFMAVGLGLLGFGASGTALAVFPGMRRVPLRTAAWSALLVAPATSASLLAIAKVPFDAYLITLEPVQALYLAVQVAALTVPFFCIGLAVGSMLAGFPPLAGSLYGASFVGAGTGALAAVAILEGLPGPAAMLAGAACAGAGAALLWWSRRRLLAGATAAALALLTVLAARAPLELPMSPYKALNLLRRFPDARIEFSRSNAISRVDVVRSAAVRSAPGLSHAFPDVPPPLPGLLVDGEGPRGLPADVDAAFTDYLTTAAAYRLRRGHTLIIGLGVEMLGAQWQGVPSVTVVEQNPLVVEAAQKVAGGAHVLREPVQRAPGAAGPVSIIVENPRTYLNRTVERFDVIQIPPQESFQVVASGAFSLTEHYLYTVEAFRDYLRRLAPGGVLAVTRWIQTPPSEEIRVWAAAVAALEDAVRPADPGSRLAALRSLNTLTILIKPDGISKADLDALRTFVAARQFDIVYAPGVAASEGHRFLFPQEDVYRQALVAVLDRTKRGGFLAAYPFDVRPAWDNRPFFFHVFRWGQVPQILAGLGRTWQPFGGGGYLVLLALLLILTVLSAGLILIPLQWRQGARGIRQEARPGEPSGTRRWVLVYFLLLGFAYLFVEIPLLQQMILVMGSPTYAAAAVLSALLVASGTGSFLAPRLGRRLPFVAVGLGIAVGSVALGLPVVAHRALELSAAGRLVTLGALILPLGVLMGVPFPAAIHALGATSPSLVGWAWGINGCASVLGAVLATLMALEWGFRTVLLGAALAYSGAAVAASKMAGSTSARAARTSRRRGS